MFHDPMVRRHGISPHTMPSPGMRMYQFMRPTAYAGIGSRRTPADVLSLMYWIANMAAARGLWLYSGHAPGADYAFERGAGGRATIYLPWRGFGDGLAAPMGVIQYTATSEAYAMAAEYHPAWDRLSRGARALMARNCHQVLGPDLASPVRSVVCWTPDGSLNGRGSGVGGTGQALRIAARHGIPVVNLRRADHRARIEQWLRRPGQPSGASRFL